MDIDSRLNKDPIPVHRNGGIFQTKVKDSCQGMARGNFISVEEEAKQNQNLHVSSPFIMSLKSKTPAILKLNNYKNVHQFFKILFKETRELFPLAGSCFKKTEKKLKTIRKFWA